MRKWLGVIWTGALVALVGCGTTEAPKDSADGGSGTTGQTTDSGGTGGGDTESGSGSGTTLDAPAATLTDVRCAVYVSGDTIVSWTVEGTATDPQGADTLQTVVEDGVVVMEAGMELFRTALSCSASDISTAQCSGTFVQWDDATDCSGAGSVQVSIEVVDEDGHRSASAPMAGRAE